jgi:hypothetical protein
MRPEHRNTAPIAFAVLLGKSRPLPCGLWSGAHRLANRHAFALIDDAKAIGTL